MVSDYCYICLVLVKDSYFDGSVMCPPSKVTNSDISVRALDRRIEIQSAPMQN